MIDINNFKGFTDSDVIDNAFANIDSDRTVVISPRISDTEPERDWWLIDRAILIPENTTVILRNCKIKLSDKCRDNFFRTANCGWGIEDIEVIHNIHIKGEGICLLEGADNPRATGDSEKILANQCPYTDEDLCKYADWIAEENRASGKPTFEEKHNHSFGTDAGKEGETQYGDWRGIGILFANCVNFSISGIKLVCTHGWGISLEECSYGTVEKIEFESTMYKEIGGMLHNMENQDGLDLRNGCHHILISDIKGRTGDDVIALTAIAFDREDYYKGGGLSTHIMHEDWTRRDRNIHDIIIRNVIAFSSLCFTVRLLPGNCDVYNIVIDGIIDMSPENFKKFGATLLLGNCNPEWGKSGSKGMRNISVSNVISRSSTCILLDESIYDSTFSNIVCYDNNSPLFLKDKNAELINVKISGTTSEIIKTK
ncbi:MAG: hypothetical protein E7481_06270 [Ruminococcaceae bacterium]|nr:hypothetical protein [Oscillospiraceae bacterium]